ncbi:MAG: 50S ribosomal protein L19 [Candidatus Sumerlaeia bacterium]|nr:50S ribosomal protein L19 [Candidatus Sumerlaeia bacterium]
MKQMVRDFEARQLRSDVPEFRPGDTVRVSVRIKEGDKERVQDYEGVVIKIKGEGLRETFTVRRLSFGVGMERIFPMHSPRIEEIKVVRRGIVRRAKLYYLRSLSGKKARIRERRAVRPDASAKAASAEN